MLPTGKKAPTSSGASLAKGMAFGEMKFDDVFSGSAPEAGRYCATIEDPENERRLEFSYDDKFPACVVFVPPHRQALCIEPYSCLPDPFWLEEQGIKSGLILLRPGESWIASMRISIT